VHVVQAVLQRVQLFQGCGFSSLSDFRQDGGQQTPFQPDRGVVNRLRMLQKALGMENPIHQDIGNGQYHMRPRDRTPGVWNGSGFGNTVFGRLPYC
jgi:hypothetical protein